MVKQPFDLKSMLSKAAEVATPSGTGAPTSAPSIAQGLMSGLPDPSLFPSDELLAASERVLRQNAHAALQYGGNYGFEGLRDYLVEKTRKDDGRSVGLEQVLLTSGSSQALTLSFFAFLNPGDTVVVEAPTWGWLLNALRTYQANVVAVPLDEQGMSTDLLAEQLDRLRGEGIRPKLVYTIANFHNPAGVTLTSERRHKLLELAANAGAIVLEDYTYGDLRYEGDPPPSLLSMDERGQVIKMSSFSKVLSTGLRVGWAVGSAEVIAAMASLRYDLGVSPYLARTVAEFVNAGHMGPHLDRILTAYRARRDTMMAALGEHCGPRLRWRKPEGSFYIWVELAPEIDPAKLSAAAAEEGTGYMPGTIYYTDGGGSNRFRIAYSSLPPQDIEEGVARLGRALDKAVR